ncbi:MAG: carbohydrate binding domain-containing protein [Planctomycetaceae bacterium]|jgi:hypothetical protein|nr:carbohydrate binding domain-containing protein [Planctomycetaceae bacterium]
MKLFAVIVSFLSTLLSPLCADEFAPLFPFALSADSPKNVTNIADWNDAPAGKYGFIRVENGKFVHNQGRFLIWGTNLAFSANFPDKEQAEKLADRLARFGFNCVRLHHIDAADIWGHGAKSLLTIDSRQLDKLDYLICQLKLRGIYVNINLHVSRWLDDRDGFTGKTERPQYDKGLDNFYPPFIKLQKKYAEDLLTHVNPYTKTAYFEEPAVAMLEINNENSVVSQWANSQQLMNMPEPYSGEFRKQWNDFLKRKYKTDAALCETWKNRHEPLGSEMLSGNLESQKWYPETDSGTVCKKIQTGKTFRFEVEKNGKESWHPLLIAGNQTFEAGKVYTFSIRAKADKAGEISINIRRNENDYGNLGFSATLPLTTQWQTFTSAFVPKESSHKARFDIGRFKAGVYEFAGATLKPGGTLGLLPKQTLESGTIPLVGKNGCAEAKTSGSLPKEAVDDFCEFLFEIEEKYWLGMYRFLKDEIKVRQPVSGTQVHYGSTTIQAKLDYVDVHSYWNHPHFPRKRWDRNDWTMDNRSLVNYAGKGILPNLATSRVHGKPYTVSEFDAPFPNQYGAEALPMLAAFGRFQDWDGIFHFAYAHSNSTLEAKKITGYFDMVGNAVKLVHQPACAAMFRRGDVSEGKTLMLGSFSPKQELALFKKDRSAWNFNFKGIGLDPTAALIVPTALDVSGKGNTETTLQNVPKIFQTLMPIVNESRSLMFASPDSTSKGAGWFQIHTPNTKLFAGFLTPLQEINFGELTLSFSDTKTRLGWAAVSIVSMTGNGFDPARSGGKPIRVLAAATGLTQNSGMTIEQLGENKITYGDRPGNEPVLCEGIPFLLQFTKAKSLRCYPLDESGSRRKAMETEGNSIKFGPEHKTLWYEVELAEQ